MNETKGTVMSADGAVVSESKTVIFTLPRPGNVNYERIEVRNHHGDVIAYFWKAEEKEQLYWAPVIERNGP